MAKAKPIPAPAAATTDLPLLLLVDDSEAILALEKAALGSTHRLETAANGRIAMESMQRHIPDGVLLDLSMPEMDGDAVLLAMRQDPRLKDVPVVVISTESQRARDTLRMGADDFLPKPVTAEDLRRTVAAVLEAAASKRANLLKAFLFFRAGSKDLGLALDSVHSVTARPALHLLPGAPAHVPGFFELYGEAVPVLDLARRLGSENTVAIKDRKVVVVDCQGLKLGLEAEEVWDPEGLPQEAILGPDRFAAPFAGLQGLLECLARGSRGLVPVLRSSALLEERDLEALRQGLKSAASGRK